MRLPVAPWFGPADGWPDPADKALEMERPISRLILLMTGGRNGWDCICDPSRAGAYLTPAIMSGAQARTEMAVGMRSGYPMRATKSRQRRSAPPNGLAAEVLTLSEAAPYLRLSEPDVLQLIQEQGLPARQVGTEWRLLNWLSKSG